MHPSQTVNIIGRPNENLKYLVKLDRSGKASNKSEKTEESDEKKLETISTESEWVFLEFNIVTDGGSVNVGLGRSGQESRQSRSLLSLKHGKTIFVDEVSL